MRLGTTWGCWGDLGFPARPCCHDQGTHALQHVKRKGMLGIPAELDLARLQTAQRTSRYDTTRTKEKNPTQDSPARTVTRIAALSVCQQSIDQSINQLTHSIQSYRFHPSTYIGYIQTTIARDYAKVQLD